MPIGRGNGRRALIAAALASLTAGGAAVESLRRPAIAQPLCALGLRALGTRLGVRLAVRTCRVDPFSASIRMAGVEAVDARDLGNLLSIESIDLRLAPLQSLAGGLSIERLTVAGVRARWKVQTTTGPSPRRPERKACWGRALRYVHLGALELGPVEADIDLGVARVEIDSAAVQARGERGRLLASAELSGQVALDSFRIPIGRATARVRLDPRHHVVALESFGLDAGGLRGSASGRLGDLCRIEPDVEFRADAPLAALARLLSPSLVGSGALSASGRWAAAGPNPGVSLHARVERANLGGYRLGDLTAALSLGGGRLGVDSLRLFLDEGGEADLRGSLVLSGRFPLTLDAVLRRADLARTLDRVRIEHSLVDLKFTGRAHVAGPLLGGLDLTGETEGDVDGLTVDDWGWDRRVTRHRILTEPQRLHVKAGLSIDGDRVRFDRARLRGPATDIGTEVALHYDAAKGIKLSARAARISLGELGVISGIPWSGEGTASVSIAGPYSAPAIGGHADLRDLHFDHLDLGHVQSDLRVAGSVLSFPILFGLRGRTAYNAAGSIDFARDLWIDGDLDVGTGRLEDLTAAIQGLNPALRGVHEALAGEFSGHGRFHGPIAQADAQVDLDLGDFTIFGRALSHGALACRLTRGTRVVVDSLSAQAGEGRIEGAGTIGTDGSLALHAAARDLPLGPLLHPDPGEPPGQGRIDADATLTGSFADWRPGGQATIRDFSVLGVPLGTARVSLRPGEREVLFSGAAGDEAAIRGVVQLHAKGPYTATLHLATQHLERYLRGYGLANPPAGALEGTLSLAGDILDPVHSTGLLSLSRLTLSRQALRVANDGPVRIALDGPALEFRQLALSGVDTRVRVSGRREGDGRLQVMVNGQLDTRLLEGLVPHVERLGGILEGRADLRGSWEEPAINGTLALHRGRFDWKGWPLAVRDMNADAQLSERRIVIDKATATANGGEAALTGDVKLRGFDLERCALTAALRHVPLRIPEVIPSVVSGRVNLYGVLASGLSMAGDLHVERARYTRELGVDALLDAFRAHPRPPPPRAEAGPPLHLDLRLHGDGDLRVESDFAQLALHGDLVLTGTSDRPGLLGSITAHDGLVQFRENQYHVSDAAFTFASSERIVPSFDVNADTDVRQYRVLVHVYGTPDDFQVRMRSQPALGEDDVVKLLLFGITSRDSATNVGTAGDVGYLGDVLWNLTGMQAQVHRLIPHNQLLRDFSFNVGSAFLEATGQVEPVAKLESRVLTDDLRLSGQFPLTEPQGKRVDAEYLFDRRMSLRADWNNDYSDYNVGDLGLDLRMRWELGE